MDKWLDAYSRWPPMNQLIFSGVFILAVVLVLFLFGVWVIQIFRCVSVARHGWPGEDKPVNTNGQDMAAVLALLNEVRRRSGLGSTLRLPQGLDWKEEHRRLAEEQRLEREAKAKLQEQMDQMQFPYPATNTAEKKSPNSCTDCPPGGHIDTGGPAVAKEAPAS